MRRVNVQLNVDGSQIVHRAFVAAPNAEGFTRVTFCQLEAREEHDCRTDVTCEACLRAAVHMEFVRPVSHPNPGEVIPSVDESIQGGH